jgi:hypothetical protein
MDDDDGKPKWELVLATEDGDYLDRVAVPGGWLYRDTFWHRPGDRGHMTMCFVPLPPPLAGPGVKRHD